MSSFHRGSICRIGSDRSCSAFCPLRERYDLNECRRRRQPGSDYLITLEAKGFARTGLCVAPVRVGRVVRTWRNSNMAFEVALSKTHEHVVTVLGHILSRHRNETSTSQQQGKGMSYGFFEARSWLLVAAPGHYLAPMHPARSHNGL